MWTPVGLARGVGTRAEMPWVRAVRGWGVRGSNKRAAAHDAPPLRGADALRGADGFRTTVPAPLRGADAGYMYVTGLLG